MTTSLETTDLGNGVLGSCFLPFFFFFSLSDYCHVFIILASMAQQRKTASTLRLCNGSTHIGFFFTGGFKWGKGRREAFRYTRAVHNCTRGNRSTARTFFSTFPNPFLFY